MNTRYSALVVGASGIIGNAVVRELHGRPEWQVRALPRTLVEGVETIKANLLDAPATRQAPGGSARHHPRVLCGPEGRHRPAR